MITEPTQSDLAGQIIAGAIVILLCAWFLIKDKRQEEKLKRQRRKEYLLRLQEMEDGSYINLN